MKYPFKEGEKYWTIENNEIVKSYWDYVSEELFNENPLKIYYKTKKEALKSLEQKLNRIHHLRVAYLTRHHRNSPFKSLGQILAFMYVYGGYTLMESCTVGDGAVHRWNKPFATFVFDEEKEIPIFTFIPQGENNFSWVVDSQKIFLENFNEITKHYEKVGIY